MRNAAMRTCLLLRVSQYYTHREQIVHILIKIDLESEAECGALCHATTIDEGVLCHNQSPMRYKDVIKSSIQLSESSNIAKDFKGRNPVTAKFQASKADKLHLLADCVHTIDTDCKSANLVTYWVQSGQSAVTPV